MRKRLSLAAMLLLALLAVLAACTPRAAPAPTAAPAPAATLAAPAPTAAPQRPSPGDADMQQLIKAAQQESKLIMYDATFFTGDRRIAIPKAFKERYGIPMEVLVTGGSSATIERLQVEQKMKVAVADLFVAGSLSGPRMITLGLARPGAVELPVLKDKGVFTLDPVYSPGGEAIVFGNTHVGVVANSKLVQPGEIKSYKDLMNPKYKGKIIIRDPRLGSGGAPLTLGTLRHLKILDDDFLRNLVQQQEVAMWGGGELEHVSMLARGEFIVDLASSETTYGQLAAEGAPIMPLYMQEGTVGMPAIILMAKAAPHPNAARLFINWLLTAEGQTVYHKAGATSGFRRDVPDFRATALQKEPIRKLLPTSWEMTQAINKMLADKEFDNVFGKR